MENEATVVGDFDQNVLGFQPSHRSRDHQALGCSVDLDRNILLLHLFLHPFSLYNALSLLMRSPQCLLLLKGSYRALEKALYRRSFRRCLARKSWVLLVPIAIESISPTSSHRTSLRQPVLT